MHEVKTLLENLSTDEFLSLVVAVGRLDEACGFPSDVEPFADDATYMYCGAAPGMV